MRFGHEERTIGGHGLFFERSVRLTPFSSDVGSIRLVLDGHGPPYEDAVESVVSTASAETTTAMQTTTDATTAQEAAREVVGV